MLLNANRKAFVGVAMSAVMACALTPAAAFGVTSAEKRAEVLEVQEKLTAMADELEVAVDNYNSAQRSYEQATAKVKKCKKKIDAAQSKIENLQSHLGTRAAAMYRGGSMSYLDVLMGVGSFDDFATVWDTLNNLNKDDADLVADTKVAKMELEDAKKELDEQEAEAKESYSSAAAYKSNIESQQAAYSELYNSLSAEYQQLLAEEQAAAEAAAAAAAAAYNPSGSASSYSGGGNSGGGYSGGGNSGGGSSYSGGSSDGGSSESYSYSSSGSADSSAVSRAESLLGTPYQYGGASSSGIDCSGLVSYALTGDYGHAYVSQDFWGMSAVSDPQPGDVVACHEGHCGLYIGNGQMIEAPHTGSSVKVSAVRGKIVRP